MRNAILLLMSMSLGITGCTNTGSDTSESSVPSDSLTVFGTLSDGTEIHEYVLANQNGMEVRVISYGGIITSLKVPDRDGNSEDVVLGFSDLDSYVENNPYFGAIIGRYGNRIAKGRFTLDSTEYELAVNNIGNHLHGGMKGFDKVVWDIEPLEVDNGSGLLLTYSSADGEEGYPGKLDVAVKYILGDDNSLSFVYEATTDKPTVVNLTQHTYFNLSAMEDDILGHEVMLNASRYLPVDSTLIPTGELRPVEGTPFNFMSPKLVGTDIGNENQQLNYGGGFDHCWVIDKEEGSMALAATVYEPNSGRFMEVYTTEPAIQFYTGNFLDGSLSGKGNTYGHRSGLCLETQHYPDSPNQPEFPSVRLDPGQTYSTESKYVFSSKQR